MDTVTGMICRAINEAMCMVAGVDPSAATIVMGTYEPSFLTIAEAKQSSQPDEFTEIEQIMALTAAQIEVSFNNSDVASMTSAFEGFIVGDENGAADEEVEDNGPAINEDDEDMNDLYDSDDDEPSSKKCNTDAGNA